MLAAEETTGERPAGLPAAGGGDAAAAAAEGDGESGGGGGESGEEPGELPPRELSRSVQDFLTLTAPLDSLELGSERTESDPEQEGGVVVTQEGAAPAEEGGVLQECAAPQLKEAEKEEKGKEMLEEKEAAVSIAPSRPPVEGATGESGAATAATSPPSALPPPQPLSVMHAAPACLLVSSGAAGDGRDADGAGEVGGDERDVGDARAVVKDPGGGGGNDVSLLTRHAVPQLCLTEATPPRPTATARDDLQTSPTEEPPLTAPRAFRFVLNEKSECRGGSALATESNLEPSLDTDIEADVEKSVEPNVEASTTATSEYFTATDITLTYPDDSAVDKVLENYGVVDTNAAGDGGLTPSIQRQLTSTPCDRRSPSFNDYIEASYQTAVGSLPDSSNTAPMGSRQSAPVYSPLARDDVSVGSEAGCDAALLAGDDESDILMSDIRQELKEEDSEPPGGAGDVPRAGVISKEPAAVGESPLPTSPAPPSETAEPASPPRSPSLSSTFGHSTCDELAELPDEEEVRSLCSRAELAPSKLWGSAEEAAAAASPARPDRRLSADVVTVIEAAPGRERPVVGGGVGVD